MDRPLVDPRSAVWAAIAAAVALLAITAFLNDLYPRDWRDLEIAGAVVAGAAGAIFTFRRDSLARALMWFASLAVVTALILYDVLDVLVDPFIKSDWPVAAIAMLLVIGLATVLGILISDEG
jgi:peptidoglycan/LPS O-acetylase OafA/YrhL